jgi:hypothetical protein
MAVKWTLKRVAVVTYWSLICIDLSYFPSRNEKAPDLSEA